MATRIYTTTTGTIEASLTGAGTPVLFLHGGHSNCHDTLSFKNFDLEQYQVIMPSRPGYGRTPLAGHTSPEAAADLIAALIEELGFKDVVVYGISAGGPTALALAANHPEKVRKLILASAVTSTWLQPGDAVYRKAQKLFSPKVEWLTWQLVHFFAWLLPGVLAKSFHSEFSTVKGATITKTEARELTEALLKYQSGFGFLNDIDQKTEKIDLSKISCPTLILHSQFDNSVPVAHARYAHAQIKTSTLQLLENKWGHMLWIGDDYNHNLELLLGFIEQPLLKPEKAILD
ncbi:MAG: alpha/beta hydrolase [Hymenobacteraceae bacterium]|nr:alpha/beta hydrolase [Hymenobacteraceae bacterium]MDX5397253.1 alpha/beta hydrolase [Hymenobacteraceae bacterium]MDX5442294.1 alpha/beta hydrolase [Hymenobacteraceae bacterium]MDX5513331.1 alpha/beta hydrolase [Hymenobacteraceae bacterium]